MRLLSRKRNEFKSFLALNLALPVELCARSAVLDGEIVCLDGGAKPNFRNLLFRRGEPRFMAFDILWSNGEDIRRLPLIDRKRRLRSLVPIGTERLLYGEPRHRRWATVVPAGLRARPRGLRGKAER
jgi:bifunctional non-homologous end joining protein LigD